MREKEFELWLRSNELAENTVNAYCTAVRQYYEHFDELGRDNLACYKGWLIENYKPKSVNQKLQGINKYLSFLELDGLKLKSVKIQQSKYLENVISNDDYNYFIARLKAENRMSCYFAARYLCATGARISELVEIRVKDVETGYIDIIGKGNKLRRLYFPDALRTETLRWLKKSRHRSEYLFINRYGERITTRGIAKQLKVFATEYGINPGVVYPHSFRHRFAKNFLDSRNDLALLADLMGHESIETTRIYLRQTSVEQQKLINKIVTW